MRCSGIEESRIFYLQKDYGCHTRRTPHLIPLVSPHVRNCAVLLEIFRRKSFFVKQLRMKTCFTIRTWYGQTRYSCTKARATEAQNRMKNCSENCYGLLMTQQERAGFCCGQSWVWSLSNLFWGFNLSFSTNVSKTFTMGGRPSTRSTVGFAIPAPPVHLPKLLPAWSAKNTKMVQAAGKGRRSRHGKKRNCVIWQLGSWLWTTE